MLLFVAFQVRDRVFDIFMFFIHSYAPDIGIYALRGLGMWNHFFPYYFNKTDMRMGGIANIVKYGDSLPWAVQKRLNQSRCCLECGLGWTQGTVY